MYLRLMIEGEVADSLIPRLQEYFATKRHVMVDPGGDEQGIIGQFVGAVDVYGCDHAARD